jgi:cyclopropane fatty-acyl-phospholipid synthase-like methyltransferase
VSPKKISKYQLYEAAVQSPNWQVDYLPQFHQWATGKEPLRFREDFCGSARISCEWVKRNPKHIAQGLDLDSKVLAYAKQENWAALSKDQQKRIQLKRQDVRKVTREKFDWIGAFNYSIFEFHERSQLLRYFKSAKASLNRQGTLFLEIAGGPGFLAESLDQRKLTIKGVGKITQAWEQHQYDPITSVNDYSIHFRLPDDTWLNDAFRYHWRIWNIREIHEALKEAGFRKSLTLWEKQTEDGSPASEFLPAESATPTDFYVCYIMGIK